MLPFPSHEVDPYRGLAPHFDVASARARALYALSSGVARLIVASAPALLPRLTPPPRLRNAGLTVRPGDDVSPVDLGDRLVEAGYTRQDPTDEPGEFSVRGGVVDLYPPGARQPVRLEFIGDTVESVRTYDPSTQRSTRRHRSGQRRPAPGTAAEPASGDADGARRRIARRPSRLPVGSSSDPAALGAGRGSQPRSTSCTIRSRRASPKPGGRIDASPEPSIAGHRLDRRLAPALEHATALETLALEYRDGVRHIASQPVMEFAGRVPDWVAELRQSRDRGETLIFVAHSQGRAERVVELLADYEMPAAPIERGEDAHAARRARRGRASFQGISSARCRSPALGRDRRLRRRAADPRAPPLGRRRIPLRLPRSQGRRPRRPRRSTASACSSA